jgi:hypothetical protein
MARNNGFVGFGVGLLLGVVVTISFSVRESIPRAMAQVASAPEPAPAPLPPPPPEASPRYQLSAWAHSGNQGSPAAQGAYVLDTRTGQVWLILGRGGAQQFKVGKVGPE